MRLHGWLPGTRFGARGGRSHDDRELGIGKYFPGIRKGGSTAVAGITGLQCRR
jgi:hypothetical protein